MSEAWEVNKQYGEGLKARAAQQLEPQREQPDLVNHPPHYTNHPSGIECIQITEHMGFNLGNAVKYIWRCDLKANEIEDLRKARWYIDREIERRMKKMEGGGS